MENALSIAEPSNVAIGRYVWDKCEATMYKVNNIFASLFRYALNYALCALII